MNTGIEALDILAEQFARLPGIGRKSAQRLALALLEYTPEDIAAFTAAIGDAKERSTTARSVKISPTARSAPCVPILRVTRV